METYNGQGRPPAGCPATFMSVKMPRCRVIHDHVKGTECVNAGDGWRSVRTLIHVCNDHDDDNQELPHGFVPPKGGFNEGIGPIRWHPDSYGGKENVDGKTCPRCQGKGDLQRNWITGKQVICTLCEGSGKVEEDEAAGV